jgi:hypothetical protein
MPAGDIYCSSRLGCSVAICAKDVDLHVRGRRCVSCQSWTLVLDDRWVAATDGLRLSQMLVPPVLRLCYLSRRDKHF